MAGRHRISKPTMSLATRKTKINAWLAIFWVEFAAKQETYFQAHGKYFQGLYTHTLETGDSDSEADDLDNAPSDQAGQSWRSFMASALEGVSLPCRFRCDVYELHGQWGYVLTVQVKIAGKVYERSKNFGWDTGRTKAWAQIEVEEP